MVSIATHRHPSPLLECRLWHPLAIPHQSCRTATASVAATVQCHLNMASRAIPCRACYGIHCHPLPYKAAYAMASSAIHGHSNRHAIYGILCHLWHPLPLSVASIATRVIHHESRHRTHAITPIAIYGTPFAPWPAMASVAIDRIQGHPCSHGHPWH